MLLLTAFLSLFSPNSSNPEVSGLTKPSKVQAQQVRTISKQRITGEVLGSLNEEMMVLIDATLKLHLGLV
ncbi:MAG: type II toxin-antitoxin system PemK/MazF family toxin [Nostoc sp.]|uniref:type II toxin-antitoxin system PemK/MazF family toxin n=1 Tax=Nostoc sp. TaxID=1180 RepID=UPI002FF6170A